MDLSGKRRGNSKSVQSRSIGLRTASASSVHDMGMDHGRAHVFMSNQFWHSANIVSGFQQMGGKTVAKDMITAKLGEAHGADGSLDSLLQNRCGQMVFPHNSRPSAWSQETPTASPTLGWCYDISFLTLMANKPGRNSLLDPAGGASRSWPDVAGWALSNKSEPLEERCSCSQKIPQANSTKG